MTKLQRPSLWLGTSKGYFTDWITQRWVQMTGRRIDWTRDDWLSGPVGKTTGIGRNYFLQLAEDMNLRVRKGVDTGLVSDFALLASSLFDPLRVPHEIVDFYEHTAQYDMDVWAEWTRAFQPFGQLVASFFSRRLQQLNVPISALDTSHGVTSEIIHLMETDSDEIRYTAWIRQLIGSGDVLYAGSYSICQVPGYPGPCVKVVFPLPNGNAVVIMKPELHSDGSFSLTSSGKKFGEPGFYFVALNADGGYSARYVHALRESIRVYPAEEESVRADHHLTLFDMTFLRLHYRLRKKLEATPQSIST